jgi:hypothetical protein
MMMLNEARVNLLLGQLAGTLRGRTWETVG